MPWLATYWTSINFHMSNFKYFKLWTLIGPPKFLLPSLEITKQKKEHFYASIESKGHEATHRVFCFVSLTVMCYTNAKVLIFPLSHATLSLLSQWYSGFLIFLAPFHKLKTLLSHKFSPFTDLFSVPLTITKEMLISLTQHVFHFLWMKS